MESQVTELHVLKDWKASYPDPVQFCAGDIIYLTDRTNNWNGHQWVWVSNSSGKEGWVPDTLPTDKAGICVASRDYSALELSCCKGEVLTGLERTHGWVLCRNKDGQTGWIPDENLAVKVANNSEC